jgi:catechol 2,3-dioxygenase-like lactoylglutathione lyase family enzyme
VSINHVQLGFAAAQRQAVRRFYAQLLGLSLSRQQGGDTLRFIAGAQRVDLAPVKVWQTPTEVAHLAFEVEDLPALRARLLGDGLELDEARPLAGHLRFYVRDPADNVLEFLQPDASQAGTL